MEGEGEGGLGGLKEGCGRGRKSWSGVVNNIKDIYLYTGYDVISLVYQSLLKM